jgi:hypothetical protein
VKTLQLRAKINNIKQSFEWVDVWMDGWMDGRMNGSLNREIFNQGRINQNKNWVPKI